MAQLPQKEISWRNKIRPGIIKLLGVCLIFVKLYHVLKMRRAGEENVDV